MASNKPSTSRQTTLFQTWGYEDGAKTKKGNNIDDDDMDGLLLEAMNQSVAQYEKEQEKASKQDLSECNVSEIPDGFDLEAGHRWIYPINYPVRGYQLAIVESCLFDNTLVCLPTGLGKTFIAAVVMYNFYRWYPRGKIVFMAPTKPLVAQQMEACFNVMGIEQAEMCEMTGNVSVNLRKKAWNSNDKRVIFLTPQVSSDPTLVFMCRHVSFSRQVMSNDLSRGAFSRPRSQVGGGGRGSPGSGRLRVLQSR